MKRTARKKPHKKKRMINDRMVLIGVGVLLTLALSYYVINQELVGQATSGLPKTERMMEADYIIGENDSVSIVNVRAYEGPARQEAGEESDYQFQVYGKNNQMLKQLYFPAYFAIFDPFEEAKEIPVTITVPYREEYATVDLVRRDEIIYRHDVSALCRQDGICQKRENAISCPLDCPSGSADNYCDRKIDDVCDPDCLRGDEDCSEGNTGWILTIIGTAVILAAVALFLKKRRRIR